MDFKNIGLNINNEMIEQANLMMAYGLLLDMHKDGKIDERSFRIVEREYKRRLANICAK